MWWSPIGEGSEQEKHRDETDQIMILHEEMRMGMLRCRVLLSVPTEVRADLGVF